MKTVEWTPNPEGPPITGEAIEGQFGPGEKHHDHTWLQRGEQHDYDPDTGVVVVSAVEACTDPECGAARLLEWNTKKHVEDPEWVS